MDVTLEAHFSCISRFLRNSFCFILSGLGFLCHESVNSQIPVCVQGMSQVLACPDAAHFGHLPFFLFPLFLHHRLAKKNPKPKQERTRRAGEQTLDEQMCSVLFHHVITCATEETTAYCVGPSGQRGMLSGRCAVVLHRWTENRGKGVSQRA